MTCAKVVVEARLVLPSGLSFVGRNTCMNPQSVCPRLPGEGYEKCRTICRQPGHAEMDAIAAAHYHGQSVRGGHMIVNYHHICAGCRAVMDTAGVTYEVMGDGNG